MSTIPVPKKTMLGDNQEQKVEGGSVAIQALGDVTYNHGLSFADVREICTLLFHENFPKIREDARLAAEQHVRDFVLRLDSDLVRKAGGIDFEKFRNPDVQASINDAVQASARRGEAAHPDLLSTLIAERVAKQSSGFKDIVIAEALTVVPKLTIEQIMFITFVQILRATSRRGLPNLAALEPHAQKVLINVRRGFNLSDAQKEHVVYAGACTINRLGGGDVYEAILNGHYKYLWSGDAASFKTALLSQAPTFAQLIDQFSKDQLLAIDLTSVGQAIAIASMSTWMTYWGRLDYSVWLN